MPEPAPKSLPLILARELAANLATPMFLSDRRGMLVYWNDAAALLLGKPFAEIGEVSGDDLAAVLDMSTADGEPLPVGDSPAGIAFFERRPSHQRLFASTYDGTRRFVEATAYPLLGANGEMHGVINVFWEREDEGAGS